MTQEEGVPGINWCEGCGEDPPLNDEGYCPKCATPEETIEP